MRLLRCARKDGLGGRVLWSMRTSPSPPSAPRGLPARGNSSTACYVKSLSVFPKKNTSRENVVVGQASRRKNAGQNRVTAMLLFVILEGDVTLP